MAVKLHIPRMKVFKAQARRIFSITFTLVAMMTAALLAAALTMRFSIHGKEVQVPDLSGLTMEQANQQLGKAGLNLNVEDRFYSATVPSGYVISQSPLPGTSVRRDWHVRVTESTGAQKVAIPDVVGEDEHEATMKIRRALMEPGTMAHIAAPGIEDVVLAQTPPPNAEGVDKPSVSLLLSEPETATAAWVMPSLVGLSYKAAVAQVEAMGMRLTASNAAAPVVSAPAAVPAVSAPAAVAQGAGPVAPVAAPAAPVAAPVGNSLSGVVTSQVPAAGSRVSGMDAIRVVLNGSRAVDAPAAAKPAAPTTTVTVPN